MQRCGWYGLSLAACLGCMVLWSGVGLAKEKESDKQAAKPAKSKDKAASATPWMQMPGPSPEEILARLRRVHPRLLMDAAKLDGLRERIGTDPAYTAWDKQIQAEAQKLLAAPLPQHVLPDGLRLLATSRRTIDRVYTLVFAYRLHGERRYLDRLWKELETVAAFPDFNPKHFLDTAEMVHAFAIAYDWLYDTWTPEQRTTLREAIIRHGLMPGLKVYRGGGGWARSAYNWNQVCNGGLTLGALALADESPELCGEILASAIRSVPLAMANYAPDGAWGEGPGYWSYATSYNVRMIAGLESALGTDFSLASLPGFDQAGTFPIYMSSPIGKSFNYADAGDGLPQSTKLWWLAQRFHQPAYAWYVATPLGSRNRIEAYDMPVWYSGQGKDPTAVGLPLDKYFRHAEVVSMRGDWTDPKAAFVAMKAGSNRVNHCHLDLGSFIFDTLGTRWVVDLGADNYNLPGYFGRERFTYYRLRAEGHNTIVLNPDQGPDQEPKASTTIGRFEVQKGRTIAVTDLTAAYAKHARQVQRGLALVDRRAVVVQDEVTADKAADFWWFVHTAATIRLADGNRTAVLEQDGLKLFVRLAAPAEATFEVRKAQPLPSSPANPSKANNSRVSKLAIHLPQVTNLRLVVLFSPQESEKSPELKPLAEW